jgi:hypothetical protein
MIQNFVKEYAVSWNRSVPDFPFIAHSITLSEKQRRENVFDEYIDSVKALKKRKLDRKKLTESEEQLFVGRTRNLLCDVLDYSDQQLGVMFSPELLEVTRQFVRRARDFDSALTVNAIFQACRNMWIMNGLQIVLGLPVRLSSSIFAYSLLYPYTDNLIDNPDIAPTDKSIFNHNFRLRLDGQDVTPGTSTEKIIFRLVAMIEAEFPRSAYPEVYASLIAIHEAQTRSVQLLHSGGSLSEAEILEICIAKGGASVLADGYLVAGKLSREQEFFLYGYGAYLQLLDDIQDARDDRTAGLHTVFSRCNDFLEAKVNRTYWFGERVMRDLSLFGRHHLVVFGSLMRKSMDLLVIGAIAQNSDLYSNGYASAIENYSPFSFSYIQKHKEQFVPYNGFLLTAIEEIAFNVRVPAGRARETVLDE